MDIASIQMVWTVRRLSSLHRTETSHHGTETRNRQKTENPTKGPSVDKGSGSSMISVGSKWAYQQQRNSAYCNDETCVSSNAWQQEQPSYHFDCLYSQGIQQHFLCPYGKNHTVDTAANGRNVPLRTRRRRRPHHGRTAYGTSQMNHSTPSSECPNDVSPSF